MSISDWGSLASIVSALIAIGSLIYSNRKIENMQQRLTKIQNQVNIATNIALVSAKGGNGGAGGQGGSGVVGGDGGAGGHGGGGLRS